MKKKGVNIAIKLSLIFLTDILLAAIILGVFAYSIFLVPESVNPITLIPDLTGESTFEVPFFTSLFPGTDGVDTENPTETPDTTALDTYISTITPDPTVTAAPTKTPSMTPTPIPTPPPTPTPTPVELGCEVKGELTDFAASVIAAKKYESSSYDRTLTMIADDSTDGTRFVINKIEIGSGNSKITYYVVDLYVSKVTNIKTNVALSSANTMTTKEVDEQAEAVGAKLAISGDSFLYIEGKGGYIIRNGVSYRDKSTTRDYCLLYLDGTMRCVKGTEFERDREYYTKNLWQSWIFGPSLLYSNGKPITNNSDFNIDGITVKNPRSAIGYVSPGHYVLMLVDGRQTGYSCGATMKELAAFMYDEGCTVAYNLDGGQSAALYYNGAYVNSPYAGGRKISDIIYIN